MNPSYLVRTPSGYCFRLAVPFDLQRHIGLKELRYSLKTGEVGLSKQRARLLAGQVQRLFRQLRAKDSVMKNLTDTQIQSIVKDYVTELLEESERELVMQRRPQDQDHIIAVHDELIGLLDHAYDTANYSIIPEAAREILNKMKLVYRKIVTSSEKYAGRW